MKASSTALKAREYYVLTKPGIIRGNLMTTAGGYFLAAHGIIYWQVLIALLIGTSLVIASACIFNNIFDRQIDKAMTRTRQRPLVTGTIAPLEATIFATVLLVAGLCVLVAGTNWLTAGLGLLGFVTYVMIYSPAKHRTPYATLIGTLPGAIPPVAGYTASSGAMDLACLLLFAILVCWQMPHFYAIAIRRLDDYREARIPVWPLAKNLRATQVQMVFYAIGFVATVVALSLFGFTGLIFGLVMGAIGCYWAFVCLQGFRSVDSQKWAKGVFLLSLPILPLFSLLLVLNAWIV